MAIDERLFQTALNEYKKQYKATPSKKEQEQKIEQPNQETTNQKTEIVRPEGNLFQSEVNKNDGLLFNATPKTKVGQTVADIGVKIAEAGNTVEGWIDSALALVGSLGTGIANIGKDKSPLATVDKDYKSNFEQGISKTIESNLIETPQELLNRGNPSYNPLDKTLLQGKVGSLVGQGFSTIGEMLPSIVLGGYNAGLGQASFGLGAMGRSTEQALKEGASLGDATLYGAGSGLVELGTEKLFGFVGGSFLGKSADTAINSLIRKSVSSKIGRTALKVGMGALGEGVEEGIAEIASPMLKNLTYSKNEKVDLEAVKDSVIAGVVTSLMFGGTVGLANQSQSKISSNLQELDYTQSKEEQGILKQDTKQQETYRKLAVEINNELASKFKKMDATTRDNTLAKIKEEYGINWFNEDGSFNEKVFEKSSDIAQRLAKNTVNVEADIDINALSETKKRDITRTISMYKVIRKNSVNAPQLKITTLNKGINGYYNPKTNTIVISSNADSMVEVIKHEFTHYVEKTSQYKKLQELAITELKSNGDYFKLRKEIIATYNELLKGKSRAEITKYVNEELVAQYCEKIFTNQSSINTLYGEHRSIFNKAYSWIKDNIALYKGELSKEDIASKKRLEKIEAMYVKAQEEVNVENDIKFSLNSRGEKLSPEQQEFFKDSVMRTKKIDGFDIITNNGDLKVMYHGTNSNFFQFSNKYIGTANDKGWYGEGYYFAFSEGEASYYGRNILKVYLNIKKPFFFSEEMQSYDNVQGGDIQFDFSSFVINLSNKFPSIANQLKTTIVLEYQDYGKAKTKDMSFSDLAEELESIYKDSRLVLLPIDDRGTTHYQYAYKGKLDDLESYGVPKEVVAIMKDKYIDSMWELDYLHSTNRITNNQYNIVKEYVKKYDNELRTEFFGYRFLTKQEALDNRLSASFNYLRDKKYRHIDAHMPEYYMKTAGNKFAYELKKQGYDGIIQSKAGDEAVAFYPNQIKLTTNLNPTESDDIRYSLTLDKYIENEIYKNQDKYIERLKKQNDEEMFEGVEDEDIVRDWKPTIEEWVLDELDKKIDDSLVKFGHDLDSYIDNFGKEEFGYVIDKSRSTQAGRYPSQYINIYDQDENLITTIRISDGHTNHQGGSTYFTFLDFVVDYEGTLNEIKKEIEYKYNRKNPNNTSKKTEDETVSYEEPKINVVELKEPIIKNAINKSSPQAKAIINNLLYEIKKMGSIDNYSSYIGYTDKNTNKKKLIGSKRIVPTDSEATPLFLRVNGGNGIINNEATTENVSGYQLAEYVKDEQDNYKWQPIEENDIKYSIKQRSFQETSKKASYLSEEDVAEIEKNGELLYQTQSNQSTVNRAKVNLGEYKDEKLREKTSIYLDNVRSGKSINSVGIAEGELLLTEAYKQRDFATAESLIIELSIAGTELGKSVQALSIIKKMTPEGKLMALEKSVERLNAKKMTISRKQFEEVVRKRKELYEKQEVSEVVNQEVNGIGETISKIVEKMNKETVGTKIKEVDKKTVEEIKQEATTILKGANELTEYQKKALESRIRTILDKKRYKNAETMANNITKEFLKSLDSKVANVIRKLEKDTVFIPTEMKKRFLEAKEQAEQEAILNEISQTIADQMPATWFEKFNSWRYMAMLGNAKTHLRNFTANIIMKQVANVKNTIARGSEVILQKVGLLDEKERTRTFKKTPEYIVEFTKKDTIGMQGRLQNSDKYNTGMAIKDVIQSKRKIFKSKAIEWFRKFNFSMLEAEDWFMIKRIFQKTEAEYMTARGYTEADLQDSAKLEEARAFAIREAQYMTFRTFSKMSSDIQRIKARSKIAEFLIGGALPFTTTPINILKVGIDFSPIGLIKTVTWNTKQLVKDKTITINEWIDNVSKGLTGTLLTALGYILAKLGIVSTEPDDDQKANAYKKQLGEQNYSIKIGDNTYTLDWLSPSAMPLFTGAKLHDLIEQDEKTSFVNGLVDFPSVLLSSLDPLTDMSLLSGLNNLLSNYSDNRLSQTVYDTLAGYVKQAIPTALRQIARSTDSNVRITMPTNYGNIGDSKELQKTINDLANRIPIVSQLLEPKIDVWGNEVRDTSWAVRIAENMFLPFWVEDTKATKVDDEILDLYYITEDNSIIPTAYYNSYFTIDSVKYELTAKEFTEYKKNRGKYSFDNLESLFASEEYKAMTLDEKVKAISKIYSQAHEFAKEKYLEEKQEP